VCAVFIDFQWTGPARSGVGDVIYFLVGGVDNDTLACYDEMLDVYYTELIKCLDGVEYTREEFMKDCAFEYLDYFKTAIPQLHKGLCPELCKENASKYGWLTHEFDEEAVAWFYRKGLDTIRYILGTTG
jgi:hypothetical protein